MSKKLKEWMAGEVKRGVGAASACVVVGYKRLPGGQSSDLRSRLRAARVELTVLRNRVTKHALKGTTFEAIGPMIAGPTAVATGGEDAAALAKAVVDSLKGRADFVCRGGFVEGKVVTGAEVAQLAALPSRLELLSMIASAVAAPTTNIARGISAILAGPARAVEALREKRASESGGGAPAAAPPA
ncbi:MAG TPA: 50S ribosomal protein L10 [Planctomycetota bacterium]|nr:50S ribosomal protein L10 [Planctomycetota bacterium]